MVHNVIIVSGTVVLVLRSLCIEQNGKRMFVVDFDGIISLFGTSKYNVYDGR